jgi:hypothetical protein
MGRKLTPVDLRVIDNVLRAIARSPWFEPSESRALARYLIHQYTPRHDEASLMAIAELFAREWFGIGRQRYDALSVGRDIPDGHAR